MADTELRLLDAEIHIRVMGMPAESRLIGDGKTMETAFRPDVLNAAWRVRSPADQYWERWSPDGAERIVNAPRYSTDITAAMTVVEKMRERGWSFACTLYEGKLPYASFCKRTAASSRNAEANTLPLAICRAALSAVSEGR